MQANWWKTRGLQLFFGLFVLVFGYFKFTYHELWKDEWQVWMMGRDMGWLELFGNLYFEGHPALWYIYVKCWTYVYHLFPAFDQATILQVGHFMLAVAAFYWLLFRLRYPIWLKLSLLFSYFIFFEYGLVNRGYVLVLLLGFMLVERIADFRQKPWPVAILLFLLCQVEVYSTLMVAAFGVYLLAQKWVELGWRKVWSDRALLVCGGGAVLGGLVFLLTIFPYTEGRNLQAAFVEPFAADVVRTAFQGNFVNTFWLGVVPDTNAFGVSSLGLGLSAVVLLLVMYFFWRVRAVWISFIFFTLIFFLFSAGFYAGGVRQWGMLFLYFVFCLHLWYDHRPKLLWDQRVILASFLLFQLIYTGRAVEKEFFFPFTNAKATGAFIAEKVPPEVPVVVINKFAATPVVGYAGRNFYALPDGDPFSYFKWTERIYIPPEVELKLFGQFKKVRGIIILSYEGLDPQRYPNVQLWQSFDGFSLKNENYYLYTLPTE
ncbi:MAG: hypothetical protein AAF798_13555 [Bacteroidota bacterium]